MLRSNLRHHHLKVKSLGLSQRPMGILPSSSTSTASVMDADIMNPPFLSLDLWLETFVHLRVAPQWKLFTTIEDIRPDLKTFRSLVLTSRQFKILAEPLLYERFSLRKEYEESPGERLAPLLKVYPEKVAFIKYMSIDGLYGAGKPFNQEITDLLSPGFCQRLTNLKAIRLQYTHLAAHTVSTLIQLPSLQVWESHFVKFLDDPRAVQFDPSALNLTRLLLRLDLDQRGDDPSGVKEPANYGEEQLVQMALSPPLQVLHLTCSTISPKSMIEHIKNPPLSEFKSLHRLKIQLPFDLTVFHDFAQHCPNVTYAELEDFLPKDAPLPPLPQALLPHMRVFHSTPGLVPVFVSGRPVDTLKFTWRFIPESRVNEEFKMMALHTPNLKSLSFCYWTCCPGDLVPIGEALPNLEELDVHAVQGPQGMWCVEELSELRRLRMLRLAGGSPWTMKDETRDKVMDTLLRNHPFLEELNIGDNYEWKKPVVTREY